MVESNPLSDSPLFGLLSPRLQNELVATAHPLRVAAREWLFHAGDAGVASTS